MPLLEVLTEAAYSRWCPMVGQWLSSVYLRLLDDINF